MKGMNAATGRSISAGAHLRQSIGKILTTPSGTCVERRSFGSEVPDLLDAPNNGATRTRLYAAVATSLMRWEPRVTLTRVQLNADQSTAGGQQVIDLEGYTTESGDPLKTSVRLGPRRAA